MYFSACGTPSRKYDPTKRPNILQVFDRFAYRPSPLGGLPVLSSSVGTLAVPRGQRCVLFDGVNDIATRGARLTNGEVTQLTVHYSVMQVVAATNKVHIAECDLSVTQGWEIQSGASDATRSEFYVGGSPTTSGSSPTGTIPQGELVDICWVYDGTQAGNANRLKLYRNGVAQTLTFTGTIPASIPTHANAFTLGAYVGGAAGNIKVAGCRVYSVAKTAAEVLSICQQHLFPSTIDRTGALAIWPLQEESGTTHYDISGNGRNLTATNITQATYHATDAGVKYSFANELGYTLSGALVIPRNEAVPTQDAAGGALQFAGPIALSGVMEVPCVTGDGASVQASLGTDSHFVVTAGGGIDLPFEFEISTRHTAANGTILVRDSSLVGYSLGVFSNMLYFGMFSSSGNYIGRSTTAIAINTWNRIRVVYDGSKTSAGIQIFCNGVRIDNANYQAGSYAGVPVASLSLDLMRSSMLTNAWFTGQVADLRFTKGGVTRFYPLQAGPGSSSTNRDIHWVASDGNGGVISNAIVNGTVSSIWANRTNVVEDWCVKYGGGIAANGSFILGRIGSSLDAAGNAKTFQSGEHQNPFSRIKPNHFDAPAGVNIGSTSSDAYAPSGMAGVQAESVADTRFASEKRYAAFRVAQTATDKTNAEGWAAG